MESLALEEKINKIRLRNEEIKRRYEEVEADKKNAAKLDALAKPIPQEDWPTRKEPPEFSAPVVKQNSKPKQSARKHNDQPSQHYTGSGEGKKNHTFADGQGPPPDPKYNFLADSEREEPGNEIPKDSEKNRAKNKVPRGGFKKRGSGRDWHAKELWNQPEASGNSAHPDYEAWRAERNRIDEARISRQRTAEGNWRREWDNDKFHLADENTKRENRISLGEVVSRQEYNENDKVYRSPRTAPRISRQPNARDSHQISSFSEPIKSHGVGSEGEKRVVVATEKNIKILLNPQATAPSRSSVMSVKVSPPNIAGTGRVGPRQRPRVTYSSQSEAVDSTNLNESPSIARQRSIDDSPRVRTFETHKVPSPKSPHYQRKSDAKNQYHGKKENFEETPKSMRRDSQKSSPAQKQINLMNYSTQFSRDQRRSNPRNDEGNFHQDQKLSDTENHSSCETTNNGHDTEPKELEEIESTDVQNPEFQLEPAPAKNQQENFPNSSDANAQLPTVPPERSPIDQHENFSDANNDAAKSNDSLQTQFSRDQRRSNARNDDGKFFQGQKLSDTENNFSCETRNNRHDTEPKKLEEIESTDVQNPEFQLEPAPAESREISGENEIASDENQQENCPNSTDANAQLPTVSPENSTIDQHEKSSDVNNDAAKSNDSLHDIEPSEAMNCSVNSGVISNDSGFIELPSNDSFHDISDNAAANKVDEESPESLPSTSVAPLILPTVQIEETDSKPETNTLANDPGSEVALDAADSCENEKNVIETAENIATESKENESAIVEKSEEITQEIKELENACSEEVEITENKSDEKKEDIDKRQLEKSENLSADDRNEICNKLLM